LILFNIKFNKTESIELINFYENREDFEPNKRSLQNTNDNKCSEFSDCFNCTSYSDKNVDCYWFKGSCMNNTSQRLLKLNFILVE